MVNVKQSAGAPRHVIAWPRVLMALSLGLGVVIRLRQFAAGRSLWLDEAALGLNIIQRSAAELLRPLDYLQGAPIGYLWLVRLAVVLGGPSERMLRAVSLLAGVAALLLFALLARRLLDEWPAALAIAILAFAPPLISYSNELKQYSLDVLVAVVALALFFYLRRPLTAARVAAGALAGTVLIWLAHHALFMLAAVGLVAFVEALRRGDRRSAGALAVVGLVWGASVVALALLSLTTLTSEAALLDFWSSGFVPAPLPLVEFARWWWFKLNDLTTFTLQLSAVALVVAAAGIVSLARRDRGLVAVMLLPIGLTFLAAALRLYPFADRLLLFTTPLVALLVAEGTADLYRRLRPLGRLPAYALVVVLLASPLLQAADLLRAPQYKEELRPALARVADAWQEGDRLVVYYSSSLPFKYYRTRHAFADEDIIILERSREDWMPYFQAMDELVAEGGRVWLLFSHVYHEGGASEEALLINFLYEQGFGAAEIIQEPGASAYLFVLP